MEKKYTLIVMLPKGDKTLVRNSDNCVVATFPPNTARFECKEWDKYLRTHKEVRDSFELKYDCMMMFIVMIFVFIAILFVSGTDYEDVKNFMDKED